jgi:thioredoxin-like negative regulator of GroEL
MATVVHEPQRLARKPTGKPTLVFFHSQLSGRCRRVEGFVAQVLQRRRNHDTFRVQRVAREKHPELFEHFRIEGVPALVVIEERSVQARLEAPKTCREIEAFLSPWLK